MTRDGEASEAEANGQFFAETFKVVMSANADSEFTDLIHELGHAVAAYDTKSYAGLLGTLRDWYLQSEGFASYEGAIERIMEQQGLTREEAEEEFFSEAMAGLFSTDAGVGDFLEWLNDEKKFGTQEKKSILKKFAELLQDVFDHIKALIRGGRLSKTAEDFALMQAERAQDIRQRFLEALDKAGENARGETKTGTAKNSIKKTQFMDYNEQIERIFDRNLNGSNALYVGQTSDTLKRIGVPNLPIAMNQSDIRKSMRVPESGKSRSAHGVSREFFKKLPQHAYRRSCSVYQKRKWHHNYYRCTNG